MDRHKSSSVISVRVPNGLRERIDILAVKSLISTNQWCLKALSRVARYRPNKENTRPDFDTTGSKKD